MDTGLTPWELLKLDVMQRMTVLQASLFMGSEIQQTVLTMVHTSMGRIMSNSQAVQPQVLQPPRMYQRQLAMGHTPSRHMLTRRLLQHLPLRTPSALR